MPFQSEKQRRYLHANHPEIAKRWEKEYSNGGISNFRKKFDKGSDYGQFERRQAHNVAAGKHAMNVGSGGGDGNNNNPPLVNIHKGPSPEEIAIAKAKAEAEKRRLEAEARQKHLKDFKKTQKKKTDWIQEGIDTVDSGMKLKNFATSLNPLDLMKVNPKMLGIQLLYNKFKKNKNKDKVSSLDNPEYDFSEIEEQLAFTPGSLKDKKLKKLHNQKKEGLMWNEHNEKTYQKLLEEDKKSETPTVLSADGGVIRKKYSTGSNGVLDIDGSEEITTEEGNDISLVDETETGVSTLFRAKNNDYAIQGGGPNYLGEQPEVKVPRYWKSSPEHPDTELAYITEPEKQVLIDLNLHGGLEDGKPNTGPNGVISLQGDMGSIGGDGTSGGNNEDKGSDHGHSRFDSGYYGGTTTTSTTTDSNDNYKDPILSMVDKTKIPGTQEYIDAEKEDWVEIPERKSPLTGEVRPKQVVPLWKANQFEKIDAHVDEITKFGSKFWVAKTLANTIKNKLPFGILLPTIYPKVDIHGNVIKDHVTGSDLGHFQGEEWDHLWENVEDNDKDDDGPEVPVVKPVTEEIGDSYAMVGDWMSRIRGDRWKVAYLDKLERQAAELQENRDFQENTMFLNSGGLANLFRVKN
jgi:hypothetical protein